MATATDSRSLSERLKDVDRHMGTRSFTKYGSDVVKNLEQLHEAEPR